MASASVSEHVLKVYTTLKDAQNDTNALKRTSGTALIVNGEQDAGYGFFTHQEYFFRIEANDIVKEIYIDWDDGDNNDPLDSANFSRIILDPPSNVAITSHIFTRDPTQTAQSYASGTTHGHFPKIAVLDKNGFKSKFYAPNLSRFLGIDTLKGDTALPTNRNNAYIIETDTSGSATNRIPIFVPTPKPPIAVLKADRKRVYAGINNELLVGGDVHQVAISDLQMASGTGTVTLTDGTLGHHEIFADNVVVLNFSNDDYDETVYVKDVTETTKFTYTSTLPSISDISSGVTGTATFTTHRGALLSLVSNKTVMTQRTAVQVEVTYRTLGKRNIAASTSGYQGGHGDIRVDVLSFGGTVTTQSPVIELLKVELLDLKEATSTSDTGALYPGERIALKVDDFNSGKVYSQYKMIAEVSLGNPIVEVGHKHYTVTYDATESFSRIPEATIDNYYIDTGHDYWMSHGIGADNDKFQEGSTTQISDTLADFKGDTLKTNGVKKTGYSFIPAMEFLDEDNRWLPKQMLARAQVETSTPNAQNHDAKATYTKSYLTHWRDESGGLKDQGDDLDYSSTREGVAGYNWPDDMLSSNLLAFQSNRQNTERNFQNLAGNNSNDVDSNSRLWKGPGHHNNCILYWNYINTGRRVGGPIGNVSGGHGGPTNLEHEDNVSTLVTCSKKPFTELYFRVVHGIDSMMNTTNTNTADSDDDETGDARYLYHCTPRPIDDSGSFNSISLLTTSSNNGTRRHDHQLNRIIGLYTARTGNTDYERTISDIDFDDRANAEPTTATVTTSTVHGLSVGDEVFVDCQHTVTGTASGGNTTKLEDSGVLTQVDNYWIGAILTITAGTGAGKVMQIKDSDSSDADVNFEACGVSLDSTSQYSLVKDYGECVVVETVPSTTTFTYKCTKQAQPEDIDNLTGTLRGIAQLKPLRFLDKTRYQKHSYEKKDTSFYTSGVLRWEEPEDWISIDPARVPDRFWPQGDFEFGNLNDVQDDTVHFSSDTTYGPGYLNFFDYSGRWDHNFNKYGILWCLDTTNHFATSTNNTTKIKRYRDTQVLHCFISSEPHCTTVEVVDPMHISLNSRAISQSVSYVHKGKFQVIEDRMGMAEIRKIGNSGGTITFGGIDLKDVDGETHTRDKFHQYQRRATPVYLDITHQSGVKTRFFGTITSMSEDHPVGKQYGKFGITMQCTHILMIDSNGHKVEDGFISLGGDPLDESKFIR